MNAEDIAARLDNRPGYKIADYAEVGLPVYRLNLLALIQLRKSFPPIEEFVMRAVRGGFKSVSEIAGLLGLGKATVEGALSNLIRSDFIYEREDHTVLLTQDGEAALREEAHLKPLNQTIAVDFDGLIRIPRWYGNHGLITSQQADSIGLVQIRGFPPRKPVTSELNPNDVFDVLKLAAGAEDEAKLLLKIRDITRTRRLYLRALMLIYKSSANDVQVGFAVDGRLSEEHEMAFLKAGGIEKLRIRETVEATPAQGDLDAVPGVAGITKKVESESKLLKRKAAVARFKADVAKQNIERAVEDEERQTAEASLTKALADVEISERELAQLPVRPVAVYEHPRLLSEAMATTKTRLLIISPWIRKAIVNAEFIRTLQTVLTRGATVYLGYGIDEKDIAGDGDEEAIEKLRQLAAKHPNFLLRRLGDTHAKVLIKDRDFYITTSFNWLSFKGDPKRTFREEWGTFVGIPEVVDQLFNKLKRRFALATG